MASGAGLQSVFTNQAVDAKACQGRLGALSQQLSAKENEERHQALIAEIKSRSLSLLPGEGKHPSNNWPAEQSVLVLGLSLEAAKTLGRRFEQNAVVWTGKDGVPELLMCYH